MSNGSNKNNIPTKTSPPPNVTPITPTQPKFSKQPFRRGKSYSKSTKQLNEAIATFNAQIREGYRPVPDPGTNKFADPVNGADDEVVMSYDNDASCPDANCTSKECRTHFKDLLPTHDDTTDTASCSDDEESLEEDGATAPTNVENNRRYHMFSIRVPYQFPYWTTMLFFMVLLSSIPAISLFYYTGGRTTPEYITYKECPSVDFAPWTNWRDFRSNLVALPAYVRATYCSLISAFDFHWLAIRTRIYNSFWWIWGYDPETPQTLPTFELTLPRNLYFFIVFTWTLLFWLSSTRRSFFKVKFRPSAVFFGLIALCYLCLAAYPHAEYKGHRIALVKAERVEYDYCPNCTLRLAPHHPELWKAWRYHYDFTALVNRTLWIMLILSLIAFGPDYRVYYKLSRKNWDEIFPSNFSSRFDHNKRGEQTKAIAANYQTVSTRLSAWYHIVRHPFYNKHSSSVRDELLCSWSLLQECLNPSSLSPLIDDATAIDRIQRAAANNQIINIDKNTLTAGHNVYGDTVAVAVAIRGSLFDQARRRQDVPVLRPP